MANITPHFYTKKALLSRDIDFQQTSITSFRGSRIGIKFGFSKFCKNFLVSKHVRKALFCESIEIS